MWQEISKKLLAAFQYAASNYLPRIETRKVITSEFLNSDQAVIGGKLMFETVKTRSKLVYHCIEL